MQQLHPPSLHRSDLAAFALLPFPAFGSVVTPQRPRRRIVRVVQFIGLTLAVALPVACDKAHAQSTSSVHAASAEPYLPFVTEGSQRFNIRMSWIRGVIQMESGGNPKAVSPKGAMGLMQIMPDTWSYLRSRYQLGNDPFDPHDNIIGGTAYLRELYDRFGPSGFLAAYNAGPTQFQKYLAGLRPLPDETKRYVATLGQVLPDLPINDVAIAAVRVPNWQRATLFIVAPIASSQSAIIPSGRAPDAASTPTVSALSPQADGLFVPIRTTNQP